MFAYNLRYFEPAYVVSSQPGNFPLYSEFRDVVVEDVVFDNNGAYLILYFDIT